MSGMDFYSHNSVAVLAFRSDGEYPRLTVAVLAEIHGLLDEIERAGLFEGVVISASSRSFAVGAEIRDVRQLEGIAAYSFALAGQKLFKRIADYPLPVVAAVRSYCLGGGLDLALACHARVAAFDASFGHPGAVIGLVTGWGGIERLTRLVGRGNVTAMLLTAERVPAAQALTMGLVDELAPSQDLVEAAARRALALRRKQGLHNEARDEENR